tara:strand:- start:316 stop:483 length:168 start_codon:yes stop_codon:yes gene_type:complete
MLNKRISKNGLVEYILQEMNARSSAGFNAMSSAGFKRQMSTDWRDNMRKFEGYMS